MKLLFATQNRHKLREVQTILGSSIDVISLHDLGFYDELPETHATLEENATEKAQFIYKRFGMDCFAEDTGLEVDALNGEPGVYSARYAGAGKSASDNIQLLLKNMSAISNRRAMFRTIICLVWNGMPYQFEGQVRGSILEETRGNSGFGYDPVFVAEGYDESFAEMDPGEKNRLSHRSKAILAMKDFLLNANENR